MKDENYSYKNFLIDYIAGTTAGVALIFGGYPFE